MSLRDGPFSDWKVSLTWTAALAVIVAGVVGVALLLSDRRETLQAEAYGVTKQVADAVQRPVTGVVAAPGRWGSDWAEGLRNYILAGRQNGQLRRENAELRQWRDYAIALKDKNERYEALLGLRTDPPIPMVSALAVTDSRSPFANTRLIDAGREKGIVVGNPVMSERGLVGRVIGVSRGAARVLLLTDVASRTPVMIDRTNARAILTGDGGPNPRLDNLRGQNPIKAGDRVLTSGDGGVIPRGLPVGTAQKGLDGAWRVRLDSDYSPIDYVRVLLFKDFTQLLDYKALSDTTMPPPPHPASEGLDKATPAAPPPAKPAAPGAAPAGLVTGASVKPTPGPPLPKVPVQAAPKTPQAAPATHP